jgi:hypothetical protein
MFHFHAGCASKFCQTLMADKLLKRYTSTNYQVEKHRRLLEQEREAEAAKAAKESSERAKRKEERERIQNVTSYTEGMPPSTDSAAPCYPRQQIPK